MVERATDLSTTPSSPPCLLVPDTDGRTRAKDVPRVRSLRDVSRMLGTKIENVTVLTLHDRNHGFMRKSDQLDPDAPLNVSYTKATKKILGVPIQIRGRVIIWREALPPWAQRLVG